MKLVATLVVFWALGCSGLLEKPDNVRTFFEVTDNGILREFQIVGLYGIGNSTMVLKAVEVKGKLKGMGITIKVALSDVKGKEGLSAEDFLKNEWNAYEHLKMKHKEAKATNPAPLKELPILLETYFLLRAPILTTGGEQLVFSMENLEMDLHDNVNQTPNDQLLKFARKFGAEMMVILVFLQYAELVHRDIKLENFGLAFKKKSWPFKEIPRVRLFDFAFAHYGENPLKLDDCGTEVYKSARDAVALQKGFPVQPSFTSDAQSSIFAISVLATARSLYWTDPEHKRYINEYKSTHFETALNERMPATRYDAFRELLVTMNKEALEKPNEKFNYQLYIDRFKGGSSIVV